MNHVTANIPTGQYGGTYKPDPTRHKKIARFEEGVLVLMSLRRPVKITMLLDSGQKYSVLVKGGEDLRTDQRVMQVGRMIIKLVNLLSNLLICYLIYKLIITYYLICNL